MIETDTKEHLGYAKSERSDSENAHNGHKPKTLNSSFGNWIDPLKGHQAFFEPWVVKRRQKDLSDIDCKITSMYAQGMATRHTFKIIKCIYSFEEKVSSKT